MCVLSCVTTCLCKCVHVQAQVVNIDQTGVHYITSRSVGRAAKGSKAVQRIAAGDKRAITAVLSVAADGSVLPPQLIFQGKTDASLPACRNDAKFVGWDFTCTDNHWSNLDAMKRFVRCILHPYFQRVRAAQQVDKATFKCVLNLDCWSVHRSDAFLSFLREEYAYIIPVFVPANCTSKGQVLDVAVNRVFKHSMAASSAQYLAEEVSSQLEAQHGNPKPVLTFKSALSAPQVKSQLPHWIHTALQQVTTDTITNGWKKVGTTLVWESTGGFRTEAFAVHAKSPLFKTNEHGHDDVQELSDGDEPAMNLSDDEEEQSGSDSEDDDDVNADVAVSDITEDQLYIQAMQIKEARMAAGERAALQTQGEPVATKVRVERGSRGRTEAAVGTKRGRGRPRKEQQDSESGDDESDEQPENKAKRTNGTTAQVADAGVTSRSGRNIKPVDRLTMY